MPQQPDSATREQLLDILALYVAKGGAARLLLPPVEPGEDAFPEPWAASKSGITLLLRRLAWHAGLDREIEIEDRRAGAPPSERKPATRLELVEITRTSALFAVGFIGDDDVVGTFAHEIGVAHAVLCPADGADPYRSAEAAVISVDPEVDLARGSIATVYLGLGVLAANAARQQHSIPERQGFHPLLVANVAVQIESGHLPVESLTFLVAVQAAVRGDTAPPPGLVPAQRREVAAWLRDLDARELRERLGIPADAVPGSRPSVERFANAELVADDRPRTVAFRWHTDRKGTGFFAGTGLGICASLVADPGLMLFLAIGGAAMGLLIGAHVRVPRCSACATVLPVDARTCSKCEAILRGDIAHLSDRFEAEERLTDDEARDGA